MIAGELVVGGVFIRLFNANPSWTVRHPKQFATELMERVLELMQAPNDNLTPLTEALASMIFNHPSTADHVNFSNYNLNEINFRFPHKDIFRNSVKLCNNQKALKLLVRLY